MNRKISKAVKIIFGFLLIGIFLATLTISSIPIVWVGSLFLGLSFLYAGFTQKTFPDVQWKHEGNDQKVIIDRRETTVQPSSRRCPSCQETLDTDFCICPCCGADCEKTCPKCGAIMEDDWNDCPYCS